MTAEVPTTSIDASHYLQREILIQLRQYGPVAYQQLKPDGVEGNAFNYHLRLLKQAGLIESIRGTYALTSTGHLVSDAFSYTNRRLMLRPHMYTMILVTAANDTMLVYRHTRGPLKGFTGLPSGKLHYNDSFSDSIAKEMTRRHLSSDYISRSLCPVSIRYKEGTATIVHRPGVLWHITYNGPQLTRETDNGMTDWLPTTEALALPKILPEIQEGYTRLAQVEEPIDLDWTI